MGASSLKIVLLFIIIINLTDTETHVEIIQRRELNFVTNFEFTEKQNNVY